MDGLTKVSKVALIGTTLFVMNTNWLNPLDFQGSLVVFDLSLDQTVWAATKIATPLDGLQQNFADFTYVAIEQGQYRFYLTAALNGVYTMDATITDMGWVFADPIDSQVKSFLASKA